MRSQLASTSGSWRRSHTHLASTLAAPCARGYSGCHAKVRSIVAGPLAGDAGCRCPCTPTSTAQRQVAKSDLLVTASHSNATTTAPLEPPGSVSAANVAATSVLLLLILKTSLVIVNEKLS
eukprot:6005651-Pyramimonas_sp.AAC.2